MTHHGRFLPKHSSRQFNHTVKQVGKAAKPIVKTAAHTAEKVATGAVKVLDKGLGSVGGFFKSPMVILAIGGGLVVLMMLRK